MSRNWLKTPQQIRLVFVAVMILLALTLGLLGYRLLTQGQELSQKRLNDQRDAASAEVVIALQKRISAIERDLEQILVDGAGGKAPTPPRGGLFVHLVSDSIRVWPEGGLAYYPDLPETIDPVIWAADELEHQKHDQAGAIAALQEASTSSDLKLRAVALNQIAWNYVKGGQTERARKAYAQLSELGAVSIGGYPAALLGRLGRLKLSQKQKDERLIAAEALDLAREVTSGKWRVSNVVFDDLFEEIQSVLPDIQRSSPRTAIAEGVVSLSERWRRLGSALASDRDSLMTRSGAVLIVWRASENAVAAFLAGGDSIQSDWFAALKPELDSRSSSVVLLDKSNNRVFGGGNLEGQPSTQHATDTGLPWTVRVFSRSDASESVSRRFVWAAGLAILGLILTAVWFAGQAVARELAVARLQSDFVSVVSHEFRTPLTALCQLSELLKRRRMTSEEDRAQCYEFLYSESHRLRRLVESLLDFGRLESGKMQFRFERVDAATLLRQTAIEFMEGLQDHSHHLEVAVGNEGHLVRADRETLRCVFWNLFENAVKYSPGCDTVWVELARNNGHVEIAVRDRGVGIPQDEQKRIFEKFVRGSAARESSVRGTGIGLAMARQIVRAHGGDITLESEPAKGSTFRVQLPLETAS
jgi:signal transduction histidine kinase